MGYVAYAVGTLIAAVAIHSFYKARFSVSTDEVKNGHVCTAAPEIVVSQSKKDSRDIEQTAAAPLIAVEATRDDDVYQQKDDTSSASDRSDSPPRSSHATQPEEQKAKAQEAPQTQSPKVQSQSQDMPPPLRPSSAPNLNSAAAQARQRATMPPPSSLPPSRARSPPRLKPATASLAPPLRPGRPQGKLAAPPNFSSNNNNSPASRPSPASTLRVPAQKALATTNMQPSLAPSTSTQAPSKRPSKKVMLAPGHSPLDWAALARSTSPTAPTTLRGHDATTHLGAHRLGRITPSQLKYQNGRKGKDAWTVYQRKVYNISAYLDFHPGGRDELMKGAGRSSDTLFAEVHPWVNWDGMLQACMVGMLVGEEDAGAVGGSGRDEVENDLDEMD